MDYVCYFGHSYWHKITTILSMPQIHLMNLLLYRYVYSMYVCTVDYRHVNQFSITDSHF